MHPRISTADAIQSTLSSGNSVQLNGSSHEVGLTMGCFASVHPDSTDLIAEIRFSGTRNQLTLWPGPGGSFPVQRRFNPDEP